ncbi:DNA translocase FtsK, partial [Ruminococcaceae bacterium OttesenSCG-928-I18]|nr:DNA translocase FtsK [Ruminococcaceae bacterium OttesenSCG-928-I18]
MPSSAKTGSKKKKKPSRVADLDRRWSILLFGIGAFLVLLACIPGEKGWAWIRGNLLFGTFGFSGWVLGALILFWAVLVGLRKPLFGWVIRSVVFMLVLSGLALVFGSVELTGLSFWETLKTLHAAGAASGLSGGLLGLVLGAPLLLLFGRVAARAIMVLFLIIALMVFFSITPGDIVRFIGSLAGRIAQRREQRAEEWEDDYPEEEEPEPVQQAPRKREAKNNAQRQKAMPPLMSPHSHRSRQVDIDLGPDAIASEEGLGEHDEVEIGPGGTFGMNPLASEGETGLPDDGPVLPFVKASAGNAFEEESEADKLLLFGKDDPYEKLGGVDTKISPGALPEIEYIGPPDAPEFDLFGNPLSAAAKGGAPEEPPASPPVAEPLQQAVAENTNPAEPEAVGQGEPLPQDAAPPLGDATGEEESAGLFEGASVASDPSVEAMIDRAAAEKPSARRSAAPPEAQKASVADFYAYPPLDLFAPAPAENNSGAKEEMKQTAELLVSTLASFGVQTKILDVSRGPSVTRYEIQPQAGVKISKITGLSDDIALNLAAAGVRIEAPIPGKPAVGIEVPNQKKATVSIRNIFESEAFRSDHSPLAIALGMDIAGESVVADLTRMPHLLIAGSTGSGKSVCVNATIMSFLYRSSPEDVRLLLIDPKVVELAEYNGIPHLLMPVVTEPRKAAGALGSAVAEMERRYHLFAENNVRDIRTFNKLAARLGELEKLPYIAIVIDELADLMMTSGKEVEDYICRIAQKARAAGMHLIVATQRPSVDVITGLIKANIPSRIAFAVSSQVDSRTILDSAGADKLLGMGDMLFMPVGANKPVRVQGTYVKDKEITSVLRYIKQSSEAQYDEGMIEEMERRASP